MGQAVTIAQRIRPYFAPPAPPLSRPTMDRRIFRVNGEPWRYCGVTAFQLADLFRQGVDIAPFVRLYRSLGANTFRVLANKPPAGAYPWWTTPPLDVALAFTQWMAIEGARVEWTLFGSKVDPSFVPAWIDAFRNECPNVFVEGINEPGHDGQWPNTDTIDATVLPIHGDLPYASGNYDPARPMRGTYANTHSERASDPCDTARKAKDTLELYDGFEGYAGFRVPWVGDEPGKPQDLAYRADAFLALFGLYGLWAGGGTFHTLSGQFGQLPDERELACATAAFKGLTAFPASTPNDGHYVHDTNDEAATGSLRTYRWAPTPYGVRVCPKDGSPILIGV